MNKVQDSLKPLLSAVIKLRASVVALAVLAVFGYTAYQISAIVAVAPDAAMIEEANSKAETSVVKFDKVTIDTIVRQNPLNVAPDLHGLGTTNPFLGN